MNEPNNPAQSMLLHGVLNGSVPIGVAKKQSAQFSQQSMFRWKCEIAIKLREGKPQDALELAEVWKEGEEYPEGFGALVEVARNHLEIDSWLLDNGIVPPPPASYSPNKLPTAFTLEELLINPKPKLFDVERGAKGYVLNLPYALRVKLNDVYENYEGEFTKTDYEAISEEYNVSVERLKMYFNNRRKWNKKRIRDETADTERLCKTTSQRSKLKKVSFSRELTLPNQ